MKQRTLGRLAAMVWLALASVPTWAVIVIGNGSTVNVTSDNFWLPTTETVQFNTHNAGYTVVTAVGGSWIQPNPVLVTGTNFGGQRMQFAGANGLTLTNTVTIQGQPSGNDSQRGTGFEVLGSGLIRFTGGVAEVNTASTLYKYGPGTLEISGSSTYTGRTYINGGALRAAFGAGLPAGVNVQLAGGALETSGSLNRTIGTGAGQIDWSWGGGFSAGGGALTVDLNAAGATNLTWNSGGVLGPGFAPGGTGTFTFLLNSWSADGVLTFVDNLNLTSGAAGSTETHRRVEVVDNPNSTADRAEIAGVLSGTSARGLNKAGAGTLVLSAPNTYQGATLVSAGTLLVNGSLNAGGGTVTVAAGAALGGTGTINRTVDVQGGSVAPGASAGTLTLAGLLLNGTSTLDFQLGDVLVPASSDRLQVNGALTLAGTLNVEALSGFGAGVYRLIDYTGVLTDSGLLLGTMPAIPGATYTLSTATGGQVNLIVDIPEPGAAALLLFGVAVGCRRRRVPRG